MKHRLLFSAALLISLASAACDDLDAVREIQRLSSAPAGDPVPESGDEIFEDGLEDGGRYCCISRAGSCVSWCGGG